MLDEIPGSLCFPRLKNPPEPPFAKGGAGGISADCGCFDVVGFFSLESLIAHSGLWANVKVHVTLSRYLISHLPNYRTFDG